MATKKTKNETKNAAPEQQVTNPMMKQFKELKEKQPNAVLLFRVGDFYETYNEDAEVCAKALGITLTNGQDGVKMAGFPYHALDTYLPKLIRSGKRVAICDQLEKPKAKAEKKPEQVPAEKPKLEDKAVKKPEKSSKAKAEKPSAPQLTYEPYTNQKGKACARIVGFTEDDPRYLAAEEVHASKSYRKDKKGNKVFYLSFGPVYAAAAERLCAAWNGDDDKENAAARDAVNAALDNHRKEKKERHEGFVAKIKERKAKKADKKREDGPKAYTAEEVAAMLKDVLAGKDIPADIEKLMAA